MIKAASGLIIPVLIVGATFTVSPRVMMQMVPDCTTETTFITVDDDLTVVAQGKWYHSTSGAESVGSYNGQLQWRRLARPVSAQVVNFSYVTQNEIVGRAIRTTTKTFSMYHDNTASEADIYKYVYNDVKKDTVGLHLLLRINDKFYASSLANGQPRAVCNRSR